ncbi:SRPBCC family protein [Planctomicrobium sp. SH668]|uniref:SRPBCC family protein n=1 Tax=Planctomicrobium sp. SH668 TaxID=3448126 RepID=UPI003F5BB2BD
MVRKILIGLGVVIGIFLLVVWLQPDDFVVERSADVRVPPEVVFGILNAPRQGMLWSPFERKDPQLKRTFTGPETGEGAIYEWDGNDDVGAGTLKITKSVPHKLIEMQLDFKRPMVATNEVRYVVSPTESGSRLKWSMVGKNSFFSKAICMMLDMQGIIGQEMEAGLHKLDEVAQETVREQSIPAAETEAGDAAN